MAQQVYEHLRGGVEFTRFLRSLKDPQGLQHLDLQSEMLNEF